MNDERLRIYLSDHIALMVSEHELAHRCRNSNKETPLGEYLWKLEREISAHQERAREVLTGVGGSESLVKDSAAWFAEKLGRFKVNDSLLRYSALSRVLELEGLALAAQERVFLWELIHVLSSGDERLAYPPAEPLLHQAQQTVLDLNAYRIEAALDAIATRRA